MLKKMINNMLFKDIAAIVAGCTITAFSINNILVPNALSTSGITGLALIAQKYTGINYTYVYYIFSIAILISSLFFLSKKDFVKILFVSIFYPTLLLCMNSISAIRDFVFVRGEMFLVCIYFSIFYGVGAGLVLRRGYSFGGTDSIAKILNKRVLKNVSVSRILLVVDGIIIILQGFVFGKDIALYALVNHVIYIYVMDYILFGFRSKLYKVSIISHNHKEIAEFIIHELNRGVTIHDIIGAYTNEKKKMVTCICTPNQSAVIRRFLAEHYPDVFMEVSPIVSVYAIGNRFKKLDELDQ